jgi:beta-glucosidase
VAAADRYDQWINRWWLDPIYRGAYPAGILELLEPQMPEIRDGDLAGASEPLDFLGLNYYRREMAQHTPGEFLDFTVTHGPGAKTDFGWEIYPQGYYEMMTRLAGEYGVKNLYLTEKGAAYNDVMADDGEVHDPQRIAFLRGHLRQVARAIADGVPVRGYFLWSLMDNFEWASGFSVRFGIVYSDYPTLRRIPKDSARWYARVIADNGVE